MKDENDFTVAYTVCDKGKMGDELVSSLKSISRFINKDNIVVFYTPPCSKYNHNIFSKYAIVKKVENVTPPFKYLKWKVTSRYGEIIGHLEEILSANLFILDCDTIIKKNITELLNGDFDIAYRVASSWNNINKQKWENLFKKYNKKLISLPNKGFMVFKNNIHKKIKNEYINYMNMDLPHVCPNNYQKDQYALALAISGYKIRLWDKHIHAFQWLSEDNVDTYVLHGRPLNWPNAIGSKVLRMIKH